MPREAKTGRTAGLRGKAGRGGGGKGLYGHRGPRVGTEAHGVMGAP